MSEFPRIDPNHPLTVAARDVNAFAEEHGIAMTLDWLGMDASPFELAYLAEQRALRAVAASMGHNLGAKPEEDSIVVAAVVGSPLWRDNRMLLLSCALDGIVIGWKGHELHERGESE